MSSGNRMPTGGGWFYGLALFGTIIIVLANIGGCTFGGNI